MKQRKTNRWYVAIMLLILTLALVACSGNKAPAGDQGKVETPKAEQPAKTVAKTDSKPAEAPKPTKIVLHVPAKSLNFLQFYIGEKEGIFSKEGLDLTITVMKSDVGISAMVGGEVDYSAASGSVVRAAATDVPVRIVAYAVKDLTFSFFGGKGINSLQDLKGKAVGTTAAASTTTFVSRDILATAGLKPGDYEIMATGNTANSLAALESGSIHATLLSPPFDLRAKDMGFKQLAYAADVVSLPQSGLGASLKKINDKPEEVAKMIRGLIKGTEFVVNNKQTTIDYIAAEFGLKPDDAAASYDLMLPALSRDAGVDTKGLETEIAQVKELLNSTAEVKLEKVADFSILEKVQKELKLK